MKGSVKMFRFRTIALGVFLLATSLACAETPPLGVALDNAALVFRTDGTMPWFGQTEEVCEDGSAARSGAVGDGQASSLSTTVSGAGTLAFWWKVSSEESFDELIVSVDGEEKARLSGERGWERRTIEIVGAGGHRVVWTYRKDGSVSRGADCGWVDAVAWTPSAPTVSDMAWTFVPSASAARPSILVSPDGKWRLRAFVGDDDNAYVDAVAEKWKFKNCVEKGGSDLTLPVRAQDADGRTYGVFFRNACFAGYAPLKRVTVPDGLEADLSSALLGVPNLASFSVTGGNACYFARDGVLFARTCGGHANVLLHYPNGKAGASYEVPDGVEAISAFAFENGGKTKAVRLSASVAAWGIKGDWEDEKSGARLSNEQYAASRLECIEVSEENPYLWVEGGALYAREGDAFVLLRYPPAHAGTFYTVAAGTRAIAPTAFARAGTLASIALPASLRRIGACAFSFSGLTRVVVPEGVRDIANAFSNAKKLVEVWLPPMLWRLDYGAFDFCSALKRVDITNPSLKPSFWGNGLPAAFGVRIPAGSGFSSMATGSFIGTGKRLRAVPILGTSPVSVTVTIDEPCKPNDQTFSCLSGEPYGDMLTTWTCNMQTYIGGLCAFRGWYTESGERVTAESLVPSTAVRLYPDLVDLPGGGGRLTNSFEGEFYGEERSSTFMSARTYDGYLYGADDAHGEDDEDEVWRRRIVGTIRVATSVARTDRRTGRTMARVTVKIQIPGERSVSFVGEMDAGSSPAYLSVVAKDGRRLDLVVGADGLSGMFGAWGIDGARNIFSSRAAEDKDAASDVLRRFNKTGQINFAWEAFREEDGQSCGWNGLSLKVSGQGRVKVAGVLADGTSVSASAQLIVQGYMFCVPVFVDRKPHRLAFCLWFHPFNGSGIPCCPDADDGGLHFFDAEGLGEDVRIGPVRRLVENAAFRLDTWALTELLGDETFLFSDYGPDGVSVEQVGTKWRVAGGARGGRVVLDRDGFVDEAKAGENPSALTLTCRVKEGVFTGSFKYYTPSARGTPVATTVSVRGVLVGVPGDVTCGGGSDEDLTAVGYGSAVVRRKGAVSVTVE